MVIVLVHIKRSICSPVFSFDRRLGFLFRERKDTSAFRGTLTSCHHFVTTDLGFAQIESE